MSKKRPRWFLKEWLKHLGVTQEELGARTGFSKGHVSDIMNGRLRYNEDTLAAFADALGRTPAEILSVNPLAGATADSADLGEIVEIWDRLDVDQRKVFVRMGEALAPKPKADKR